MQQWKPMFDNVIEFMASKGFVAFDMTPGAYSGNGLLSEFDMLFAKKDGQYRSNQWSFSSAAESQRYDQESAIRGYGGITLKK